MAKEKYLDNININATLFRFKFNLGDDEDEDSFILSPPHAKIFLGVLAKQVAAYEQNFGEIVTEKINHSDESESFQISKETIN